MEKAQISRYTADLGLCETLYFSDDLLVRSI